MASEWSQMHSLMTVSMCACVCVCLNLVWLFRKAPVRSVIDSLSGAAERPGPVNLFSQTLHPYLWAPAVLSITADQTYCVIVLAKAREPRVSGHSARNIHISLYYFINAYRQTRRESQRVIERERERCQWRPWLEIRNRISCQNQVIMPTPSDLAETNCCGSCGRGSHLLLALIAMSIMAWHKLIHHKPSLTQWYSKHNKLRA